MRSQNVRNHLTFPVELWIAMLAVIINPTSFRMYFKKSIRKEVFAALFALVINVKRFLVRACIPLQMYRQVLYSSTAVRAFFVTLVICDMIVSNVSSDEVLVKRRVITFWAMVLFRLAVRNFVVLSKGWTKRINLATFEAHIFDASVARFAIKFLGSRLGFVTLDSLYNFLASRTIQFCWWVSFCKWIRRLSLLIKNTMTEFWLVILINWIVYYLFVYQLYLASVEERRTQSPENLVSISRVKRSTKRSCTSQIVIETTLLLIKLRIIDCIIII